MTQLTSVFPPFALRLATPRLVLRPLLDEDIPAAVEAAASGIHERGRNPFSTPWAESPPDQLGAGMARWYWQCRANSTPESWSLILGIWHGETFLGCQDVGAKDFAVLRTVTTGSWLRRDAHGRGFGKEMRAAVALYAFDWLKADVAESEAAEWNAASLGVSRSLGYELNGVTRMSWGGKVETVQRVRLIPGAFKRPDWQLKVEGHQPTAEFLGL
ncbi:GNAT family N-acetyltransferase [Arthrobacter sp. NPDC093139]|uniref:GNAT family N-acetyltransferase n=1 Tax=Arthrobacter sp. NPDC093139 TaxID=3363945 RepID=UPI0038131F25